MDFKDLTYVLAIAKHQNLTKASQELFVTQPTLTKFVQSIEQQLGLKLFKRLGNKFYLTYAGERYVKKAKNIMLLKKELDEELVDISSLNTGRLKIAFPVMRGTYMLPLVLPAFQSVYPNIEVVVREAASSVLERSILSGEVDMAFFNLPIESPNIDYELIINEEMVLALPRNHSLVSKGIARKNCNHPWVDIRLFRNEQFILQLPDQRTRQISDSIFKKAGFVPKIKLETRNIWATTRLVEAGYGICFITETHLKHLDTRHMLACLSFGNPSTTGSFVAAFRKNSYMPKYTREFVRIIKEYI